MSTFNLKTNLSTVLVVFCGLMVSSQTHAIAIVGGPFDGTDVGFKDTVLATGGNLGSPDSEETYFENLTGLSLDFSNATKTEGVPWYFTDLNDVIAFQLQQGSGYYVVKNSTTTVLFNNETDLNWGVIDRLTSLNLGDDMEISHVTEDKFDPGTGGADPLPVPAPLALFGIGGLMLGWRMKRKPRA